MHSERRFPVESHAETLSGRWRIDGSNVTCVYGSRELDEFEPIHVELQAIYLKPIILHAQCTSRAALK